MRFALGLIVYFFSHSAFAIMLMNTGAMTKTDQPSWTKSMPAMGPGTTNGLAVARDSSNNVYVVGYNIGTLDSNSATGTQDCFIAKYNSAGVRQWTRLFGTAAKSTTANGAISDSSGNVYVVGQTTGGLDGNTQTGTTDLFVTKYDTNGNRQWTRQMGVASKSTIASAVTMNSTGAYIYLTGNTTGGLDGNTLTGTRDFILVKYDSSGSKQWTKQLGVAAKNTLGNSVTIDSTDANIYITGNTNGGLDGNVLTGTQDFFVITYDSSGNKGWSHLLGVATKSTTGNGLAIDGTDNLYVTGTTTGGLDGNAVTGNIDLYVTKYDATGAKLWTQQLGVASKTTSASKLGSDGSGNLYIAGSTTGDLDGNTLSGNQDFFVTKYDTTGAKQWTAQLGAGALKNTVGSNIVMDTTGANFYMTGNTTGGLAGNIMTGSTDAYITKYDSSGARQWLQQLGGSAPTSVNTAAGGVAALPTGEVYVAGTVAGGMDGNTLTGTTDFYVIKYNSDGTKQWTRQMGVATKSTSGRNVAADSAGNVYVTGDTNGALDGNAVTGTYDLFIVKYDSAGTKQWSRLLGSVGSLVLAYGATTDSSNNVYVSGYINGNGLDGNTLTGSYDFFVTKYDSTGAKQWTQELGVAAKTTQGFSVSVDGSGNVFVGGATTGSLDGNTLTGTQDFFMTKYDSTGAKQWTRQMGVAAKSTGGGKVFATSTGDVYIAGYTTGALDGNSLTGSYDAYVVKYNSAGVKQWTKLLGAAGGASTVATQIKGDDLGNVYITGTIDTAGLDGHSLVGSQDLFVTKYNASGTKQWTKQIGRSSTNSTASAIACDQRGNIYIHGIGNGLDYTTYTSGVSVLLIKYSGN